MKNLPAIQVLEVSISTPTATLINDALLIKTTGDPVATAPPVTDTVLHGQANTLQTILTGSKASPPTYTTAQVATQKKIVVTSYNKVALYLKNVATDAAIAAGDVNVGNTVVTRCGAKLKKQGPKPQKTFKGSSTIANQVDVDTKAVGKRAVYIRQYGVTPAKDVAPTVISDPIVSLETAISINNLPSGSIIGVREASLLPIPRKNKNSATNSGNTLAAKSATPTASAKAHKAVFSHGAIHYNYGNWIYVVVK